MHLKDRYIGYLFQKYAVHFVLKGGIFLYALFDGDFLRSTVDIDFLAKKITNDAQNYMMFLEKYLLLKLMML